MEINKTINELFEFSKIQTEYKVNKCTSFEERIFNLLTPHFFRAGKIENNIKKILQQKIHDSITQKLPITLIIAVGGFKNYRSISNSHIDWAEIFQLSFLLKTLYPISIIYPPGLVIEYTGDAQAAFIINNLKLDWIDTYLKEFDQMLKIVSTKLPKNIKISSKNFLDFYSVESISNKINNCLKQIDWNNENIKNLINTRFSKAENNFCFKGEKDYINASYIKKGKIIKESILKHKIWLDIDYKTRKEYLEGGTNIPIIHRKGIPGCYIIKSVKGSDIQFWEGNGIFLNSKDKIIPTIISISKCNSLITQNKIISTLTDSIFSIFPKTRETLRVSNC